MEPSRIADHADQRSFAYVISVKNELGGPQVHVIAVTVEIDGARVDCSRVGGSTRRNIAVNPQVTVMWPPKSGTAEFDEYTLIADGQAKVDGDSVFVEIDSAILHRPASS